MKHLKEAPAAQGVHTLIAQFTDLHGAGFSGPSIDVTGSIEHIEHARHVSAWELERYATTF